MGEWKGDCANNKRYDSDDTIFSETPLTFRFGVIMGHDKDRVVPSAATLLKSSYSPLIVTYVDLI